MPRSRLGPLAIESKLGDHPSQSSVWRAVSGLFTSSHDSKLQTVIRTAAVGAWDEFRLWPTKGWMSRRDEKKLFGDWDDIYRRIRESLRTQQVIQAAPSDTTTLHTQNVMRELKTVHQTARRVNLVEPREAPHVVPTGAPAVAGTPD